MCIPELVDDDFVTTGDTRWRAWRKSRQHRSKQGVTHAKSAKKKQFVVHKRSTADKQRLSCGKTGHCLRLNLDCDFAMGRYCTAHAPTMSEQEEDQLCFDAEQEPFVVLNDIRLSGTRWCAQVPPPPPQTAVVADRCFWPLPPLPEMPATLNTPLATLNDNDAKGNLPLDMVCLIMSYVGAKCPQDLHLWRGVEYAPHVLRNLQRDESLCLPQPGFFGRQPHLKAHWRAILIDWLVQVHMNFKLPANTLHLATSVVDRCLGCVTVSRRHLQLVGITAMLIAAKFEETCHPGLQIQDCLYVCDGSCTKREVKEMEVSILTALDFKILRPTALHFLERYQCICTWSVLPTGISDVHRHLGQYLLELALLDDKMSSLAPSHLAAATLLLSNKLMQQRPSWSPALTEQTKMTPSMLKPVAKQMCALLEPAETSRLQAVREKFSLKKHHSVAIDPRWNRGTKGCYGIETAMAARAGGA